MVLTSSTTFCPGDYFLPNGITIDANGITLDCNDARLISSSPAGFGIAIFQNTGVTIKNCQLQGYHSGILLNWDGSHTIENNILSGGDRGIELMQSNNNIIRYNEIVDNTNPGHTYGGTGILLAFSSSNLFEENTIERNNVGITIDYNSNNNNFYNNLVCGNYEIDLECDYSEGNDGGGNTICNSDSDPSCFSYFDEFVHVHQVSSNSLYPGRTYTINGAGFGEKDPVEPLLFDTVGNQADYSGLNQGDVIPTGSSYPWRYNGHSSDYNVDNVKYWESNSRVSERPYYKAESSGFLARSDEGVAEPDEMYINWWFRVNYDISEYEDICSIPPNEYHYTNTEIFRMRPRYNAGSGTGWVSWQSRWLERGNTFQEVPPVCTEDPSYWYPSRNYELWGDVTETNTWHNMEFYVNSTGHDVGQGHLTAWSNGVLQHDDLIFCSDQPVNLIRSVGAIPDHPTCFDRVYGSPLEISFGDIYIDDTLAKVMICNVENWSWRGDAHCEMQVPTSWDDYRVSFDANKGSFNYGQEFYVYVMNSNGEVNEEGYPITFYKRTKDPEYEIMQQPVLN